MAYRQPRKKKLTKGQEVVFEELRERGVPFR
jgi:hypothetical protein